MTLRTNVGGNDGQQFLYTSVWSPDLECIVMKMTWYTIHSVTGLYDIENQCWWQWWATILVYLCLESWLRCLVNSYNEHLTTPKMIWQWRVNHFLIVLNNLSSQHNALFDGTLFWLYRSGVDIDGFSNLRFDCTEDETVPRAWILCLKSDCLCLTEKSGLTYCGSWDDKRRKLAQNYVEPPWNFHTKHMLSSVCN